jgi:NtrC-family two-component system sensor histidine kinase KinB
MILRNKLLLSQAPIGAVLALVGLIAIWTVTTLTRDSGEVLNESYRTVLTLQRMTAAVERIDGAALLILAGERDMGLLQARAYAAVFEQALQEQIQVQRPAGEDNGLATLTQRWADWQSLFKDFLGAEDNEARRLRYFADMEPCVAEIRRTAGQILALNHDELLRKNDEIERTGSRVTGLMVATAIAAFALGSYLSITLTSRLLRPLRALGEAARRIGGGDLKARAEIATTDEIGKLAHDFNQMAKRIEDYRKSSLGELLQAQLALMSAIDSLPDPVLVIGIDGQVTTVNVAAANILGMPANVTGRDPFANVAPEIVATIRDLADHVLSGKGPVAIKSFGEAMRVAQGNEEFFLVPRATPVYEAGAGIVGGTIVFQDVTRLRLFDDIKNDMMATVAHEFRAPLTSLRMGVHLCLEEVVGPITEKQADLLHAARGECERLESMIDDLLDLSRLESGRLALSIAPAAIMDVIEPAVAIAQAQGDHRNITIEIDVPPILDDAMVDQLRITNVFRNLIDNAVRFTPNGGRVTIQARAEADMLRVSITDQGPGIDAKYHARLFDKFFRIPGVESQGAGLGLSIAREIVRSHGGEIGVTSEPGDGSTFWFTLPSVGVAARAPEEPQAE